MLPHRAHAATQPSAVRVGPLERTAIAAAMGLGMLLHPSLAVAQAPMACHAMGGSSSFGKLPPEQLPTPLALSGIGNMHLAISTRNTDTQRWFDQGLNLLHDFWDYEAARAFEQAIRLDPNCAMCYWGLYQAEAFRGDEFPVYTQAALDAAVAHKRNASSREKLF